MCKGETGNGSVRRRRNLRALVALSRCLECVERRETCSCHVSSRPQNLFHLPEIQEIERELEEEMDDYDEVAGGPLCMAETKAKPDAFLLAATAMSPHHASWLDVRVIYVRVSGCCSEDAPEFVSLGFPPRSIGTALEVNGGRISPSEEATLVLRRDRVDPESAEATYLSTDHVRTSGPLSFEVFFKDEVLVVGTLEHSERRNSVEQGSYNGCYNSSSLKRNEARRSWNMDCICAVGQAGCVFSKLLRHHDIHNSSSVTSSLSPLAMEVCLVGRNPETPVILSQTVSLTPRRRSNRHNTLDVIPEAEELGKRCSRSTLMMIDQPRLRTDGNSFMDFSDKAGAGLGYYALEGGSGYHLSDEAAAGLGCALQGGSGYGDGDDGQMTWFNAGVRVGVGLGLGMCLGVGIGIGLVVRTYHATTRTLRKGFI